MGGGFEREAVTEINERDILDWTLQSVRVRYMGNNCTFGRFGT